ncbi:hypothetical protein [Bradyrhizobium japonicum]|uniref:hypothetical protein n=1 Tax=Bradyrhizobium japonicum TaxID=375 RepID=UPI0020A2203F|nr:hypothetical protein [Bradyrhizobium japonicum]MCP1774730.1 hypothetical protein [Bradyrhizobium japonicum]
MSAKPQSKIKSQPSAAHRPAAIGHNSDDHTKMEMYVNSYRAHQKAEGVHFVEKCKVVEEARSELSDKMFEAFCEEVGLPRNSSMYRKAKIVADAADRLLTLGERLPEAKSTLYELAAVDESVFSEIAEGSGRITAEKVRAARTKSDQQEKCKFFIDATTLRHGERVALLHSIKEEAEKAGATITWSKSFQIEEARQ